MLDISRSLRLVSHIWCSKKSYTSTRSQIPAAFRQEFGVFYTIFSKLREKDSDVDGYFEVGKKI